MCTSSLPTEQMIQEGFVWFNEFPYIFLCIFYAFIFVYMKKKVTFALERINIKF